MLASVLFIYSTKGDDQEILFILLQSHLHHGLFMSLGQAFIAKCPASERVDILWTRRIIFWILMSRGVRMMWRRQSRVCIIARHKIIPFIAWFVRWMKTTSFVKLMKNVFLELPFGCSSGIKVDTCWASFLESSLGCIQLHSGILILDFSSFIIIERINVNIY